MKLPGNVIYRFDRFELHTNRRELLEDGLPLAVGQRAIGVLTALLERAWPGVVVEENNLQVQVSTLRRILGTGAIVTSASRGYRFTLEVAGQPKLPAQAGVD